MAAAAPSQQMQQDFEFHPDADIFPMMPPEELAVLRMDIELNGQREPILLADGRIADGRNRYRACVEAGIEPQFRNWDGNGDLRTVVVSLNLKRRHLSPSQLAMVAAKLATLDRGQSKDNSNVEISTFTQADAAKLLNVSRESVISARKVQRDGVPELVQAVDAGEISVSEAARISALPKDRQKQITKRGRKARRGLLKKVETVSLRKVDRSYVTCLHCSPVAKFEPERILPFLQKLRHLAAKFARENDTPNFGTIFDTSILELEEMEVAMQIKPAADKILDAIDRGTVGGEIGLVEKVDALKITKLGREEFDAALTHLIDYNEVTIGKMEGKQDTARGGRKDILRRVVKADKTDKDGLWYELDPEFEEEDVYDDNRYDW